MARYRDYSYEQALMLPISLERQIQPNTLEYSINYLVDHEIDLSVFEMKYRNDFTGAPAIDPAILLKIILFAYSRGITSSRQIARACEENVLFMALSADTRPHFTTIAEFVSSMSEQISPVFRDILAVCACGGLIGGAMFAVDGCKIASNCAKEWSGTTAELRKKAAKLEESVRRLLKRHREQDQSSLPPEHREKQRAAVVNLRRKARKILDWLHENDERLGARGNPVKSNITDNESAKMPSSHGVIQGYNGIAAVDEKHQVVVDAQAFGDGHEAKHLEAVVDSLSRTFQQVQPSSPLLAQTVLTADSGFHSEASVAAVLERGVDAYVADTRFRLRDARFAGAQAHKAKSVDRKQPSRARKYFTAADFHFDASGETLVCPAGKPMKSRCPNWRDKRKGYTGRCFMGFPQTCLSCSVRKKCIRKPTTKARQVTKLVAGVRHEQKTATARMIERLDSPRGRFFYSRRMGTVEPVFANIRSTLGLDRFTLRGRKKVDIQWKLFCIVHNIGKIARYAGRAAGG